MNCSIILFVAVFFICAVHSASFAQNYLKKLERITIIDGRKENILSMKTEINGSQTYYPYAVSYEYNKNKTLKKITKTITRDDRKKYEQYLFRYKK